MLSTCLLVFAVTALRNDETVFREGLAISNVGQRGPYAVFADHVLDRFTANDWQPPKEGDSVVGLDGKVQIWKPVRANVDGTFDRQGYSRGWVYFGIDSKEPRIMLLHAQGCGMVYADARPRAADHHGYGYVLSPVKLRKGRTGFMFAPGRAPLKAKLIAPRAPVFLNPGDPTLPDIVVGSPRRSVAGIIVVNATESFRRDLKVVARIGDGVGVETPIGPVPSLTHRKVPVEFDAPSLAQAGEVLLQVSLFEKGKQIDSSTIPIRVRGKYQTRKITFISSIDGSLQYFAVNPAQTPGDGKPLVLALHGARTEALEMADDYTGKDWCHIVCPTNRRPFGFDWEDIGRLDMLEVLSHAKAELKSDPERTYLTGHSMGGHGAWINGLMFPDKWAAVAPCAAWISSLNYWGRIKPGNAAEEAMSRAANPSDTLLLKNNGLHYPIYMHHGDKDEDVEYSESVQMNEEFRKLSHPNLTFHTMPGAGHWFGTESIDWPGIFDTFKGLKLTADAQKDSVGFSTVNPAISSRAWWLEVLQQDQSVGLSRAGFRRNPDRLAGTTENIAAIAFDPDAFSNGSREIAIDGQMLSDLDTSKRVVLQKVGVKWSLVPSLPIGEKNPSRHGPFKEAFKNRFRFVYGTKGSRTETAENLSLARFQAEEFQVGGNGSVEILSDRDFLREDLSKVKVTNIILIGSKDTNSAWDRLLSKAPIQVRRGKVQIGDKTHSGTDLACIFVWPQTRSENALVGVAASTGRTGQQVLSRLQFFMPAAHYPDWTVVGAEMYSKGVKGVRAAGFFDNRWRVPTEPKT